MKVITILYAFLLWTSVGYSQISIKCNNPDIDGLPRGVDNGIICPIEEVITEAEGENGNVPITELSGGIASSISFTSMIKFPYAQLTSKGNPYESFGKIVIPVQRISTTVNLLRSEDLTIDIGIGAIR